MNTQQWLKDWFDKTSPLNTLNSNDDFFELGIIDSFEIITLIEEIEETFSIRFSNNDFQDRRMSSIAGLSTIIDEKMS